MRRYVPPKRRLLQEPRGRNIPEDGIHLETCAENVECHLLGYGIGDVSNTAFIQRFRGITPSCMSCMRPITCCLYPQKPTQLAVSGGQSVGIVRFRTKATESFPLVCSAMGKRFRLSLNWSTPSVRLYVCTSVVLYGQWP
jgi:hypothetical protein